jgi:hypothetical protein
VITFRELGEPTRAIIESWVAQGATTRWRCCPNMSDREGCQTPRGSPVARMVPWSHSLLCMMAGETYPHGLCVEVHLRHFVQTLLLRLVAGEGMGERPSQRGPPTRVSGLTGKGGGRTRPACIPVQGPDEGCACGWGVLR